MSTDDSDVIEGETKVVCSAEREASIVEIKEQYDEPDHRFQEEGKNNGKIPQSRHQVDSLECRARRATENVLDYTAYSYTGIVDLDRFWHYTKTRSTMFVEIKKHSRESNGTLVCWLTSSGN